MILVKYYLVMGQLCCEVIAFEDPNVQPDTSRQFFGRAYLPVNGEVGEDDLWMAFNQVSSDRCAEGYSDQINEWLTA